MKVLPFVFFLIVMITPLWSGTYLLKDTLVYTGSTLDLSNALSDYKGPSLMIASLPDGWHTVKEISQTLKTQGLEDFALYGKGIRLLRFDGYLSSGELTALLQSRFPEAPSSAWSRLSELNGPFYYRNIRSETSDVTTKVSLEILSPESTEPQKIEVSFAREIQPVTNVPGTPENTEWTLILKNSRSAELIFQRGAIEIRLPVRIRQQMGPGEYLVENPTSGKAFRVRNQTPTEPPRGFGTNNRLRF